MDKLISGRNWFHPYHMATLKPQDAHGAQLNFVPNKTLCNAATVHSTLTTTLWTSACTAPCTTTAPCTAPLLNPTNTALLPDRHRTLDSSLHSTSARSRHRTVSSSLTAARHRRPDLCEVRTPIVMKNLQPQTGPGQNSFFSFFIILVIIAFMYYFF